MLERLRGNETEEPGSAKQQLEAFLQTYPVANLDKHPHMPKNWSKRWEKYHECYGDDHLITLFPKDTLKDTSHWVNTLNLLSRTISERDGFGVETKTDLIYTPDTQLVQENHYSGRTIKLVDLMRAAAKEELNPTYL
jgi:hypothetical protein